MANHCVYRQEAKLARRPSHVASPRQLLVRRTRELRRPKESNLEASLATIVSCESGLHRSGNGGLLIAKLQDAFLDCGEERFPEAQKTEYFDNREERGSEVCLDRMF